MALAGPIPPYPTKFHPMPLHSYRNLIPPQPEPQLTPTSTLTQPHITLPHPNPTPLNSQDATLTVAEKKATLEVAETVKAAVPWKEVATARNALR